jgi:hypothetical protein
MLNRRLLYQDGYWAIEADIPEHLDRNEPLPTEAERASICGSGTEGTRFHDLRHFYASTLIAANLNLR